MTVPPGLTCARCAGSLYPRPATHTQEGYVHTTRCPRICTIPGCGRPHVAKGFCGPCYKRGGEPATRTSMDSVHLDDVAWMANTGETWTGAVARLGVKAKTLEKWLKDRGAYDLAVRMRARETPLTSGSHKVAA